MIPIKLTIQGIYSYKTKQVIDFEKLTQSQLFGIFGATGSGKSSILEAIGFAIYGETERLGQKDDRSYNMMNLKSDGMLISFEFWAGKGGQERFLAEVKGKRKKKFEEVDTQREIYKWEQEQWKPMGKAKAEQIIGLNHDNFRRTIIIPQGQFQEFIQLGETERTKMLKEIFHLHAFELSDKAKKVEQKYLYQMQEKESLLEHKKQLVPELIEAKKAEILAQQSLEKQLEKEFETHNQLFLKMEQLKALFTQIQQQKQQLQTQEGQKPAFEKRRARLASYEFCLVNFQPIIADQKSRKEDIERNTKNIELKTQEEIKKKENLAQKKITFQQVENTFMNREKIQQKADELDRLADLRKKYEAMQVLKENIEKGMTLIKDTQVRINHLKEDIRTFEENIAKHQKDMPDMSLLLAVRDWLQQSGAFQKQAEATQKNILTAQKEVLQLENEAQALLRQARLSPLQTNLPHETIVQLLHTETERFMQEIQQITAELESLSVKQALKNHADTLHEGAPCPLCGSEHHPHPLSADEGLSHKVLQVRAQLSEAQEALENVKDATGKWSMLQSQMQQKMQTIAEMREQAAQEEVHYSAFLQTFLWKEWEGKNIEDVDATLANARKLQQELTKWTEERKSKSLLLEKEMETEKKYENRLKELQLDVKGKEESYDMGMSTLKNIDFEAYKSMETSALTIEAQKARKEYQDIANTYELFKNDIQTLETKVSELNGEIRQLEKQKSELNIHYSQESTQLSIKIEQAGYASLAEVTDILQEVINIQAEKRDIEQFEVNLKTAFKTLQNLEQQTKGQIFEEAAWGALKEKVESMAETRKNLTQTIGGLLSDLKQTEKEYEEKKKWEKEYAIASSKWEDAKTLRSLFHAHGFVNYVSATFLHNLCVTANERFRQLTKGALQLEVKEVEDAKGFRFQVRDFMNEGKVRSIKTLSGGQTFQAALCMALSLADSVHRQVQSDRNFFFIDEGFGSQDKDSLQIIFETLQSLRSEKRIVGVISHVEELQQEIDTYLKVVNTGEEGSIVKESWVS